MLTANEDPIKSNGRPTASPGFIALSCAGVSPPGLHHAAQLVGGAGVRTVTQGGLRVATWGLGVVDAKSVTTLLLSLAPRLGDRDLSVADVARLVRDENLSAVLPPFAAALVEPAEEALLATTDAIGFRHLYFHQGDGWAAVSSSARALAVLGARGLDPEAMAIQSLLGWQVAARTMFTGVSKLVAGSSVRLADGKAAVRAYARGMPTRRLSLDEAVREAARVLRQYLTTYLDDHPDAVLQLTGGQDSRILLSAIPEERRRGLRTMTLAVPGSRDAVIASSISARYGMVHELVTMDGLEHLSPQDAHERCLAASERLESMADPIAFAALGFAEAKMEQGCRISGLGGEVARGFYYVGPGWSRPVTRRSTAQLAGWRMFANEAASSDALDPEFARWARDYAIDQVYLLLRETGLDWLAATDEFYLFQRMQRWAGVVDTALCFDREIINPMLDARFLDLARRLAPSSKRKSRFLGRIQAELDGELARLPLDGRPPPMVYAEPGAVSAARIAATSARRMVGKARQRFTGQRRPPAGGMIIASKVVEFWRQAPSTLDPLMAVGIVRPAWVDDVLTGRVDPEPGTVALMLNLLTAADWSGGR
jgi:asparagine synthase (glutamine-hydrolysing)